MIARIEPKEKPTEDGKYPPNEAHPIPAKIFELNWKVSFEQTPLDAKKESRFMRKAAFQHFVSERQWWITDLIPWETSKPGAWVRGDRFEGDLQVLGVRRVEILWLECRVVCRFQWSTWWPWFWVLRSGCRYASSFGFLAAQASSLFSFNSPNKILSRLEVEDLTSFVVNELLLFSSLIALTVIVLVADNLLHPA